MIDTDTVIHPAVLQAMDATLRRAAAQRETLDRLNGLTGLDWIVNAEPVQTVDGQDVWAPQRCADDTAHGLGTVSIPGHDLLCPDCGVAAVEAELVADARIDVDVLL